MTTCPTISFITSDDIEFKFKIQCNAWWDMDGVIIPHGMDTTHPQFLEALRWAQSIYPYLRACEYVAEHDDDFRYGEAFPDAQDIDLIIEAYQDGIIPVDDELYELAVNLKNKVYELRPRMIKNQPTKDLSGYVYLVKSSEGQYKIGRTKNPENRMKTFAVKLPFRVEYVCVIKTDDMNGLEAELHMKFADYRLDGEWFNLSNEDVEYIKGLAQ